MVSSRASGCAEQLFHKTAQLSLPVLTNIILKRSNTFEGFESLGSSHGSKNSNRSIGTKGTNRVRGVKGTKDIKDTKGTETSVLALHPLDSLHANQQGMAILMAMLTLALVATLAAGVLWQQWRTQEEESTSRYEAQAGWLLGAALDWARIILNEDAKASSTDNKTEPWSIPLQETQLSSFLAASNSGVTNSSAADGSGGINDTQAEQIFISGRITDLQSRLNIFNLYNSGQISAPDLNAFTQLFTLLGLSESELNLLVQAASAANQNVPLASKTIGPQRIEQLSWAGVSPQTVVTIAPYVTWLPVRTAVNLNTAPPQVLSASFTGLSLSSAQKLTQARDAQPWATLDDATRAITASAPSAMAGGLNVNSSQFALNSSYFQVFGKLRFDSLVFTERSVLQRSNQQTLILWRERRATGAEPGCFSTIEPPC